MVGSVPAAFALRDLFYASGLGFLLSVAYSAARLLLGSSRAARCLCDIAVLAVGALLYRSVCLSRLYAGQPRWYTFAGCLLCFLASRAALAPLLDGVEAFVRWCLAWPFVTLWRRALRPLVDRLAALRAQAREKKAARRAKQKRAAQKKRLQTGGHVLYNSK